MTTPARPPTPKMLQWLHLLEVKPGSHRSGNRIGFICMTRGWTEWDYRDRHDEPISLAQAEALWGKPGLWDHIRSDGERITDAGRAILNQHWPERF
jgi:hypothetical protein